MSLWQIDEKTSATITSTFYEELTKGESKNIALRNAKLKFLAEASTELQFPYYWAGILLVGDTTPISVSPVFSWKWIAGGLVIILMLFLLWRFPFRKTG